MRFKRQRIVKDNYLGFEVQEWSWWWPFWAQKGFSNTHSTIEKAREFARGGCVIEYIGEQNEE